VLNRKFSASKPPTFHILTVVRKLKNFKVIKRAIVITAILNSIILIGVPAGHGYGIMVMFEFMSIPSLIRNGFEFEKGYPFESGLMLIGFVSLIGKLLLISSLFYKRILNKNVLIYSGLILMLIPFLAVTYGAWDYDRFLFLITLGSGIPFLMYLARVIYFMNKEEKIGELKAD